MVNGMPANSRYDLSASKCSRHGAQRNDSKAGALATYGTSAGCLLSSRRSGLRSIRRRESSLISARCGAKCATSASRYTGRQLVVADRVQVEHRVADPVSAHQLPRQRDHFQIGFRARKPKTLDAELVRLPVAALLRALVAKDRPDVIEPQRPERKETVFQRGADHRRGPLRAQRQTAAGTVVERVHLFFYDVGLRADASDEKLGRLEDRRPNLAIAETLREEMNPRFQARSSDPTREERSPGYRGGRQSSRARPTGSPGRLTSHCALRA